MCHPFLCFSLTNIEIDKFTYLLLRQSDDIRIKGRELVQPKFDMLREQLIPMRIWVR